MNIIIISMSLFSLLRVGTWGRWDLFMLSLRPPRLGRKTLSTPKMCRTETEQSELERVKSICSTVSEFE